MRVETARGAMAVDGLGTTLMHEHVFVLTPDVEWILRAVGQTHVERRPQDRPDRAADPQGGGRRPDEGRIGHCGDTTDLDYLRGIADMGSVLGMDRFGIDVFSPFEDRITTVAALAKAGYADWMVLAHDASCYSDFYSES
jgi:phosphotriesterase-related protein